MEMLIKASALALSAAVIGTVLKKSSPEMSLLLSMAASCAIIYTAIEAVSDIATFLWSLADMSGLSSEIFTIVLKSAAMAVITKIAADICKDSGYSSASSALELLGSATVLYIALPLFETMIQMINSIV